MEFPGVPLKKVGAVAYNPPNWQEKSHLYTTYIANWGIIYHPSNLLGLLGEPQQKKGERIDEGER